MTQVRERAIEEYLLNQCRAHRLLCLKFTSPARGGVPDRIVIGPSGTVFVEVKRPGEEPAKRQRIMHAKMRRHGARVYVVDDRAGVDSLIDALTTIPSTLAGMTLTAEVPDGLRAAVDKGVADLDADRVADRQGGD